MVEFHSIEGQDEFAYTLLKNIKNGFFLDIGCAHPIAGSNTCIFDLNMGWNGWAFDAALSQSWCGNFDWHIHRPRTKFFNIDIRTPEFPIILKQQLLNDTVIDYITIDVDGNENGKHTNYGLSVVNTLIDLNIRFKVMTLEHEFCLIGEQVRLPSRLILKKSGYKLLGENISNTWITPDDQGYCPKGGGPSEDWWIDPQYFPDNIFEYKGINLLWQNYIEKIRQYKL